MERQRQRRGCRVRLGDGKSFLTSLFLHRFRVMLLGRPAGTEPRSPRHGSISPSVVACQSQNAELDYCRRIHCLIYTIEFDIMSAEIKSALPHACSSTSTHTKGGSGLGNIPCQQVCASPNEGYPVLPANKGKRKPRQVRCFFSRSAGPVRCPPTASILDASPTLSLIHI